MIELTYDYGVCDRSKELVYLPDSGIALQTHTHTHIRAEHVFRGPALPGSSRTWWTKPVL